MKNISRCMDRRYIIMSMALVTFFATFLMATNGKKGLLIMTGKVLFFGFVIWLYDYNHLFVASFRRSIK